jgi:hypothetical protein
LGRLTDEVIFRIDRLRRLNTGCLKLVAELSPKPDVAATVRKVPERRKTKKPVSTQPELRPDGVKNETPAQVQGESTPDPFPDKPARVEPIAPARYKVTFTASAELHDKLERLRALMPDGDITSIIEDAVTEKLERLESKRHGKTNAPRKDLEETDTSASSRYIPAPVRRAVFERDGGQCSVVDEGGRRCTERRHLEFHISSLMVAAVAKVVKTWLSCADSTIYTSPSGNTVRT